MRIEGACHCIDLSYEAEIDPGQVELYNCAGCQRLSRSAFRILVPVSGDKFRLLIGPPKLYAKIAESGAERLQIFCPNCGIRIYATSAVDGPKVSNVRVGTARQRARLPLKRQCWRRSVLPWIDDIGSVPKAEKEKAKLRPV
jgi:hypothetical protein